MVMGQVGSGLWGKHRSAGTLLLIAAVRDKAARARRNEGAGDVGAAGVLSPAHPLPTGEPRQGDTGKAAGMGVGGRPPEPLGTPQCLQGACDRRGDGLAVAISFSRSKSACCLSCALLYFSERFFTFTLAT